MVEHLVVLAGLIQGQLTGHSYVCQLLLDTEDVATHLFDAILIHTPDVHHRAHEDVGDERTKTFEDVLQDRRNLEKVTCLLMIVGILYFYTRCFLYL